MVMRHFGGGIGHLQSRKGDEVDPETDSISSSEDGELNLSSGAHSVDTLDEGGDTDDMEISDDDSRESGMISSAGEDDSELELDTDDNGYDSL